MNCISSSSAGATRESREKQLGVLLQGLLRAPACVSPLSAASTVNDPRLIPRCDHDCRHPAIPHLVDFFFDMDGRIELVMELMEGEAACSLVAAVLLPAGGAFPPAGCCTALPLAA